jgi:hypothetical protein
MKLFFGCAGTLVALVVALGLVMAIIRVALWGFLG